MKKTNKILLSTVTALTLLLTGCTDGGDTGNTNPPVTENPGGPVTEIPVEPKPPVNQSKPGGWYGRTVVSATTADGTVYTHSTAGIFGELVDSDETIDKHDIPGFGTAIFQVVFPQDDGSTNGDFFSNYQKFDESGDKRTWTFKIKNQHTVDLANAPISIALPTVKKVTYKEINGQKVYDKTEVVDNTKASQLTLLDIDNATYYAANELATANLTMDGLHTRTFKWVLGVVEKDDYTVKVSASSKSLSMSKSSTSTITADGFDTASLKTSQADGKFGLPPM